MEYYSIIQQADCTAKERMLSLQEKGVRGSTWVVNKKTDQRTLNDVIELYKHLESRKDWKDVCWDYWNKANKIADQISR